MADFYERVGAEFYVRDRSAQGVAGFLRNMSRVRREATSIQRMMSTAFGLGMGYVGIRSLVEGYKSVIRSARDAAESDNLFRISMGETADAVYRWSQQISGALGLNEVQVRKNVGTYKLMLESMGLTADGATQMSQAMTQLVYDVSSFRNLRPEDAFLKLQSGITGEIEPLKRLGIIVNQTSVDEYALRQGWISHGQQLSEVGKIYARFGLIMEQTAKDQGDLARTANEAANMERRLQAQWEMARIALGEGLLPSYRAVMQSISQYLQTNLDDVRDWAEGTASIISSAVQAYGKAQREFANLAEKTLGESMIDKAAQQRYRDETGETRAFRRHSEGFGLGSGYVTTPPENPGRYEQIRRQLLAEERGIAADRETIRIQRIELKGQYPQAELPAFTYPEIKPPDMDALIKDRQTEARETDKARQAVEKHFEALSREQEIIGRMDESRFRAGDYVETQRAVAQLSDAEAEAILREIRLRKDLNALSPTQAKVMGEYQSRMEQLRVSEMVNDSMEDLASTLTDIAFDFENAEEYANKFFETLARNATTELVMQPAVDAWQGALSDAFRGFFAPTDTTAGGTNGHPSEAGRSYAEPEVQHAGGVAGYGRSPTRRVPASVFAGAPRMATGGSIGYGEVPIIAHKGETILPAGTGFKMPAPTIHVYNETQTPINRADIGMEVDPHEMVVNIMLRDQQTGGPTRNMVG